MKELHAGARWVFRVGVYMTFVVMLIPLFIVGGMVAISSVNGAFGISLLLLFLVVIICFGEVYARLAYNNWKYSLEKNSLKLERGIIWKRYSNVPYARVQNVDISRGIIARILGFSTVDVQTAGAAYPARGAATSEGHIPALGIKEAEKMRDFLMKKISKKGL